MKREKKQKKIRLTSLPNSTYIFIIMFVFLSLAVKNFFTAANLSNLILQATPLIIISVGMSLVIMSGELDLSVGGIISMSGVAAAMILRTGAHWAIAILGALGIGLVYGLFNGLVVHKMKVSAFIATFGSMGIAQSLANTLSGKRTVYWDPSPDNAAIDLMNQNIVALKLGSRTVDVLSLSVIPVVCIVIVALILSAFQKTVLGTYVYAVGHNQETARLAGINVNRVKIGIFVLSGLLAGVAGCLLMIRTECVQPTMGEGLEFYAVVASVLGGNVLTGGKGSIPGTIMGAFVIYAIRNAMVLAGFTTFAVMVATGLALIFGMMVNMTVESAVGKRKMNGNKGVAWGEGEVH